jgi:hypothetical protein
MALSSSPSASSFFSRAFSASSRRSLLALSALMPPYWDRQRVPGAPGNAEVAHHLGDVLTLVEQALSLAELAHDLLGRVAVSLHVVSPFMPRSWVIGLPQQVDHYPGALSPRHLPIAAGPRASTGHTGTGFRLRQRDQPGGAKSDEHGGAGPA